MLVVLLTDNPMRNIFKPSKTELKRHHSNSKYT
jgi:hypothetical protein